MTEPDRTSLEPGSLAMVIARGMPLFGGNPLRIAGVIDFLADIGICPSTADGFSVVPDADLVATQGYRDTELIFKLFARAAAPGSIRETVEAYLGGSITRTLSEGLGLPEHSVWLFTHTPVTITTRPRLIGETG